MVTFKNRYMVMEIFPNPNRDHPGDLPCILTQYNIYNAINDSFLANFGECGASKCGSVQVKYFNPITNVCVIRVSRDDYQKAWCAITLVKDIANCPLVFNLLDLSGSIKACRKAALKIEESKFEQYKLMVGDRLSADAFNLNTNRMQTQLEMIKALEH